MILGTVQLGLSYGRTNSFPAPTIEEAFSILDEFVHNGFNEVDTARAYGSSESFIGHYLRNTSNQLVVHTKLAPLQKKEHENIVSAKQAIESSLMHSFSELEGAKIETIMAHRLADLQAFNWKVLEYLCLIAEEYSINRVGASVQNPEELLAVLDFPEISHIQLPLNILDHRWFDALEVAKDRSQLRIHIRSCFLQGLLLTDNTEMWPVVEKVNSRELPLLLDRWVEKFKRESRADLCVAYARSLGLFDGIVLGNANLDQVRANSNLFCKTLLTAGQMDEIKGSVPSLPEHLLNPSLWG